MLTGKHFLLKAPTLGIEIVGDYREAVRVPAGEIVEILEGPKPDDKRSVKVRWRDKTLVMVADDVQKRGEEVPGPRGNG